MKRTIVKDFGEVEKLIVEQAGKMKPSKDQSETYINRSTGMSTALTLLFAFAGGAAVGNLYLAQPLLADIAAVMGVSPAAASALITITQLGYAAGVLLLVPLGDTINRKRLIPLVMATSALALFVSAIAPNFSILLSGFAVIGLTTVSGQLLVPLAGDLARDEERGRVVGTIASGMLTGILLSRSVSGLVADAFGWRAIYIAASVVMIAMAAVLSAKLPADRPREAVPYFQLLSSVAGVIRRHRAVQLTLLMSASAFCVFSLFWTSITFLLSSPPFSYSVTQIGLVGLIGVAGALGAKRAGKLHDRGWSVPATGAAIILLLVSLGIAALGSGSTILILLAVLLLDLAIQGINVLNQTRLLSIEPASRSRLNTAFIVSNFIGGAIGSVLAGVLWQNGGWSLVMAGAILLALIALACRVFGRATLQAVAPAQ